MSKTGRKTKEQNHTCMILAQLYSRRKDGTFSESIGNWKWIFSYSRIYRGAIAFYTFLSGFGTGLSLISDDTRITEPDEAKSGRMAMGF